MIRKNLTTRGFGDKPGFQWRGKEVSRLEGFSDAVFAFAVTLLVVSLSVPDTFSELMQLIKGFAAFAVSFTILILIWYTHYMFFRRYGLNDKFTIIINAALLLVVIFYIYPLKFLFALMVNQIFGNPTSTIEPSQSSTLMIIYSSGYLAVFLIFVILHLHAYRKREYLELNPYEILNTKYHIQVFLFHVAISLSSILISIFGGYNFISVAGLIYFLLGPILFLHGWIMGKKGKVLRAALQTDDNNQIQD
jgi:uncharacterized membrane protein